jgi:hypothetical protein
LHVIELSTAQGVSEEAVNEQGAAKNTVADSSGGIVVFRFFIFKQLFCIGLNLERYGFLYYGMACALFVLTSIENSLHTVWLGRFKLTLMNRHQ